MICVPSRGRRNAERGAQGAEDEEVHDANGEGPGHDPRPPAHGAGPARQFDERRHQVSEEHRQNHQKDHTGEPVEHPEDQGKREGNDDQPKDRAGRGHDASATVPAVSVAALAPSVLVTRDFSDDPTSSAAAGRLHSGRRTIRWPSVPSPLGMASRNAHQKPFSLVGDEVRFRICAE